MLYKSILNTTLLLALSPLANAHGIWLAERVGEATIVYGHGAGDDPYDAQKITYLQAFDDAAHAVAVQHISDDKNVHFEDAKSFSSVAIVLDNGYWTEKKDGTWVNKAKNEVADAKKTGHYVKTAFNVNQKGKLPTAAQLEKLELFILPQDDVLNTKIGDKIAVTVYFKGAPLADVALIGDYVNDGDVVAKTDAQGNADVPVRNNGVNVIVAEYKTAANDDQKDKTDIIGYNATLSFNNHRHEH